MRLITSNSTKGKLKNRSLTLARHHLLQQAQHFWMWNWNGICHQMTRESFASALTFPSVPTKKILQIELVTYKSIQPFPDGLEFCVKFSAFSKMIFLKFMHKVFELVHDLDAHQLGLGNANLVCLVAPRNLADNIHIIVLDYSQDDVRCGYSFCPLCCKEFASCFNFSVNIIWRWIWGCILLNCSVRQVIMSNEVDIVLLEEIESVTPWGRK